MQNSGMATTAFGFAVTQARAALGVDQQGLADAIGMKRSYLSKIENGRVKEPEEFTRDKIAKRLGLTLYELMEYAGPSITRMIREDVPRFQDVESDELVYWFNRLPDDDRDRLIAIARTLYQLQKG